jgi:hypothetical protein
MLDADMVRRLRRREVKAAVVRRFGVPIAYRRDVRP